MTPQDLPHHNCLMFASAGRSGTKAARWNNPSGAIFKSIRRNHAAGGVGRGWSGKVRTVSRQGCHQRQLVPLLEKYNPDDLEMIHAIYLGGGNVPCRMRAFIDHMAETIARSPLFKSI
jgi:DNA-binding transcriptional LysR family regulator